MNELLDELVSIEISLLKIGSELKDLRRNPNDPLVGIDANAAYLMEQIVEGCVKSTRVARQQAKYMLSIRDTIKSKE
mgnify:CR=1 FL=1